MHGAPDPEGPIRTGSGREKLSEEETASPTGPIRAVGPISIVLLTGLVLFVAGCSSDAHVASKNLSRAADMFELDRRIVFYNGITDGYILTIEGRCSLEATSDQLEVTCKTGPTEFKKHFLGISDNVTYFSEQLEPADVSVYNYRVIFKPEVIVPDIDLKTSIGR